MTTAPTPKRIPIPRNLVVGDVIVDNKGRRYAFREYDLSDGDAHCSGPLFRPDGWRYRREAGYAVKIIRTNKQKPEPVKEDADAKWLRGLMATKAAKARFNKIAKRLEAK